MFVWGMIGILVGGVAGMTGAGGAIVSIPLFIHWIGTDLRTATVYSLFTVLAGALPNWWMQRRFSKSKTALKIAVFSLVGSAAAYVPKQHMSDSTLRVLFVSVCLLSLWVVLRDLPPLKYSPKKIELWTPIIGFLIGVWTTLTGLGGGILLVPIFLTFYRMDQNQAMATSLLTIFINVMGSLLVQKSSWVSMIDGGHFMMIFLGCALAAKTVSMGLVFISPPTLILMRKFLFSFVVLLSIVGVFLR